MSELQEMQIEEPERFKVTDDAKADWCIKKIQEAEADRQTWKHHYEEQMRRVNEECDATVQHMTILLQEYFLDPDLPKKNTATQSSYMLKNGKLVMKRQQPEFDTKDEELIPWLKANMPQFVKVKETADWAGLKKELVVNGNQMITEDAEIVPGITVTPRPDIFKVEVK